MQKFKLKKKININSWRERLDDKVLQNIYGQK